MKKIFILLFIIVISISLMGEWNMKWLENQFHLTVTNYGVIGHNVMTGDAGGYWPSGYPAENYVYGSGIWFGALMDTLITGSDTLRDTLVTAGYHPSSGCSEFVPGWDADFPYNEPDEIIYVSGEYNNGFSWPIKSSTGYDSILSFRDTYTHYNDLDANCHFSTENHPLGIQVNQFTYTWYGPLLEDIQFIKLTVINDNPDFRDLKQCYFAYLADLDIGNESGSLANDRIGFIDTMTVDYAGSMDTLMQLNTGYQFQVVSETGWAHKPGIPSIVYLSSPIATHDIDLHHDSSYIIPLGSEIGMTSFNYFTLATDPSTKEERYQLIAGYDHLNFNIGDPEASYRPFPNWGEGTAGYPGQTQYEDGDKRFIMSCGPFDLQYGDSVSIVFAIAINKDSSVIVDNSLAIINFWNNYLNNKINLLSPADNSEIASNTDFSWQPFTSTDSFRFDISSVYNDTALMITGENTGTYKFNTQLLPDGKYSWNIWNYNVNFFESHSDKWLTVIDNPNKNGIPHIDEFDAVITNDRCYLTWDIFDPDGETLLKNIIITRSEYNDTILNISTYNDNYSFSAFNYLPDGNYKAFIKAIDDSLASDTSYDYFSYSCTRPHDPVSPSGGNNNTVSINVIAYNTDLIESKDYSVHFDYPNKTLSFSDNLILPYIVYSNMDTAIVLSDSAVFTFMQSATEYYINDNIYYSPIFDGIGLEIIIADSLSMHYDSVNVINDIGTIYPESLLILADLELEIFGGRDIDLHWHLNGDSIYIDPIISGYSDIIPYDSVTQYNYLFGNTSSYLNSSSASRTLLYIAGANIYFNNPGRAYPMDTLWYPEEGEIWRVFSSGDRLPLKGDIYTFRPTGMNERFEHSLTLKTNSLITYNKVIMDIIGYGDCNIKLYDITGRMIKDVFSGTVSGTKHIVIDNNFSTGIYFIKDTENHFEPGKIILIK